MRPVIAVLLMIVSFAAHSDNTIGLSKLLSVEKSLDLQISDAVKFASANFRDVHVNFVNQMGDLNEKQLEEVEKVYLNESLKLLNIVDIKPIAALWQETIHKNFNQKEIIEIEQFYASPVGKRFVDAMHDANRVLITEFYRLFEISYQKFISEYEVHIFNASICCS